MKFSTHENWRVRRRAVQTLEEIYRQILKRNGLEHVDISEVLPFFSDELYVSKAAKDCLKTILSNRHDLIHSTVKEHLKCIHNCIKSAKNKEENAQKKLNVHINIVLSCLNACGYSLLEFLDGEESKISLPQTCLILHNSISYSQENRKDVLDYISRKLLG